jgi:hypothetical protein
MYLWVGSVKAEPQWPYYPNPCVRSFVRSEKPILGFYFVAKMVHIYVAFSQPHLPGRGAARETSKVIYVKNT